jgi:hypothetical protein
MLERDFDSASISAGLHVTIEERVRGTLIQSWNLTGYVILVSYYRDLVLMLETLAKNLYTPRDLSS